MRCIYFVAGEENSIANKLRIRASTKNCYFMHIRIKHFVNVYKINHFYQCIWKMDTLKCGFKIF